jgi:carbon monoxide dehydrogenase subunit G
MELQGNYLVPAPRRAVWEALNTAEVLKVCIPGCDSLEQLSPTTFTATVTAKVGPVKAKFKGKVDLSELEPPASYKISGEGQGGPAGFAKGAATVKLAENGTSTDLSYSVDATVGGKLAQIGQRFIDATAKKMADEFFSNLTNHLSPDEPSVEDPSVSGQLPGTAAPDPGVPPLIWGTVLIIATLFALAFFAN